jgi:hypothetical protein
MPPVTTLGHGEEDTTIVWARGNTSQWGCQNGYRHLELWEQKLPEKVIKMDYQCSQGYAVCNTMSTTIQQLLVEQLFGQQFTARNCRETNSRLAASSPDQRVMSPSEAQVNEQKQQPRRLKHRPTSNAAVGSPGQREDVGSTGNCNWKPERAKWLSPI